VNIEAYVYGSMTIDGKVYKKDLVIFPDRLDPEWWRKEGHSLGAEDLDEVFKEKPEVLVIGTGSLGLMRIPLPTRLALKENNIELIAKKTDAAVRFYNEQAQMKRRVVGAFHLTC
jgi:hypothetical protein